MPAVFSGDFITFISHGVKATETIIPRSASLDDHNVPLRVKCEF